MGTTVKFSSSLSKTSIEMVAQEVLELLQECAERSDNPVITITSTWRPPERQAEAMYNNLINGRRIKYRAPGQQVTAMFDKCHKEGMNKADTVSAMEQLIIELGDRGERVSKHCVSAEEYRRCNILDISLNMADKEAFIKELLKEMAVERIIAPISMQPVRARYLYDKSEPAIHVEISTE